MVAITKTQPAFCQQENKQTKLYSSRIIQVVETLKFSKSLVTQGAMEHLVRFADEDNLEQEFVCRRKELARRYRCSERYASRLIKNLVYEGLIEIAKDGWSFLRNTYQRTYRLTKKSLSILRKTLIILEGEQKGAIGISGVHDLGCPPEQTDRTIADEKRILNDLDKCIVSKTMPNKQTNGFRKKRFCSPEAFEVGKVFVDDYLGFFRDFNEKKRFARLIGELYEKKGLVYVNELFTDLSINIKEYRDRRINVWDYANGVLRE